MAGLDPAAIAQALANRIQDGTSSAVHAYWFPIPKHQYPAAIVAPAAEFIEYQQTFGDRGGYTLKWAVTLKVVAVNPESAVTKMYDLMAAGTGHPSSVLNAIWADQQLNSTVDGTYVSTGSPPTWETEEDRVVLTAVLSVTCIGNRT